MAESFTMIPNAPMMDKQLSLRAKGVYAAIVSFAGLPDFSLSVSRLKRACSDSTYAIRSALRELKARGYLEHTFSTDKYGAFCHAYNLYDTPLACPSPTPQFRGSDGRYNGDIQMIRHEHGKFTTVPSALMRSADISLQVKALYAMAKHLLEIPDFVFRIGTLASFCVEKSKAFRSAWSKLKLSGLLKQRRHPTGRHNAFEYTYELLETPDLDRPYFSNCRSDGSVCSCRTIREFLSAAHRQLRAIRSKVQNPPATRTDCQPGNVTLDETIVAERGRVFASQLQQAVDTIRQKKFYYNNGNKLTRSERDIAASKLTPALVRKFARQVNLSEHVRAPIPYLTTSLYRFLVNGISFSDSPENENSISYIEMLCLVRQICAHVEIRKERGGVVRDRDLILFEEYEKRDSVPIEDFKDWIVKIFNKWKNAQDQATNTGGFIPLRIFVSSPFSHQKIHLLLRRHLPRRRIFYDDAHKPDFVLSLFSGRWQTD